MTWTLHHGDCLAGMATLADKSVDCVITDPPYEAEAHTKQRRGLVTADSQKRGVRDADLSFAQISETDRAAAMREMARVARRWVLVFCQAEGVSAWRSAGENAGLVYKRACLWIKPDGLPQLTGDRPGQGYECFVALHVPGRSRWNGGGKHGVYVFTKDTVRTGHETQKPLALMEALVRDFTNPGETVLDPFVGSGTTGVACIRNGRNFIGWEKDAKYHALASKRLAETREQGALFGPRVKAKQAVLL